MRRSGLCWDFPVPPLVSLNSPLSLPHHTPAIVLPAMAMICCSSGLCATSRTLVSVTNTAASARRLQQGVLPPEQSPSGAVSCTPCTIISPCPGGGRGGEQRGGMCGEAAPEARRGQQTSHRIRSKRWWAGSHASQFPGATHPQTVLHPRRVGIRRLHHQRGRAAACGRRARSVCCCL